MPSHCVIPVVEVRNIREHPNADLLSIVEVLGYQVVTGLVEDPSGTIVRRFYNGRPVGPSEGAPDGAPTSEVRYRFRYKEGDKAVYFPADTLLTDKWATEFNVKHLLKGKEQNRVGRQRLRGEPSFGLLVELPPDSNWVVGQNVADFYSAKKFEPPARSDPGDIAPYDSDIDPYFVEYSDIQNGKIYYNKFLPGEEVVLSEKLHGGNSRVGLVSLPCIGGVSYTTVAGSRTTRKSDPFSGLVEQLDADLTPYKNFTYWSPLSKSTVRNLLGKVAQDYKAQTVILFGEIFGAGVQSLHYGQSKEKGYRAFDLYVDGNYLDFDVFKRYCDSAGVDTVPILYRGPFDLSKTQELSDGRSLIPGADNIREGVVVKPVKERRDPALGRVILKFIGTEYDLSKHKDKDTTDV